MFTLHELMSIREWLNLDLMLPEDQMSAYSTVMDKLDAEINRRLGAKLKEYDNNQTRKQ